MKLLPLILLLLCSGCGMFGYLTEQGIGQAKIQWRAVDNEKLLQDPEVADKNKHKIMLVGEYKKFFYHYFNEKSTPIYTKTTMLEDEAVSYLVIASPHTKIEAHEFEFPVMGKFPYIGFFRLANAKDFARDLERDEGLVTWVRPVYAYSTLGILEDRILSSFFEYDDVELAELIFHELFHTIFFVEDEVELNENLANLYGFELLKEYFKDRDELKSYIQKEERKKIIARRVVELIGILQTEFAKLGGFITNEKADEMTERFVNEIFKPDLRHLCKKLALESKDCELREKWNQASFAAFLTYEEDQDFLKKLKESKSLNLKDYLSWLRKAHQEFKKQKKIESFPDYLKAKV
jgi:predicted aminopeptidase